MFNYSWNISLKYFGFYWLIFFFFPSHFWDRLKLRISYCKDLLPSKIYLSMTISHGAICDIIAHNPSWVWAASVSENQWTKPVQPNSRLLKQNWCSCVKKQPSEEQTYWRAWSFKLLSFEMIHIKIVKGIYAYICCIAAYNSALPIKNGTCKLRNAIVSVDRSFSDHTMLRFLTHSQLCGKRECDDYVPLCVRANRLSVCCKSWGDETRPGQGDLNIQVLLLLSYFWLLILWPSCQ